jgi:hypothetical protein
VPTATVTVTPGGPEPVSFLVRLEATGADSGPLVAGNFGPEPFSDLAAGEVGEALLRVYIGDGDGGLDPGDEVQFAFAGGFAALTSADVNLDGQLDLVGSLGQAGRLVVALGDGQNGFAPGPDVAVDSPGVLAVRDLTGDGVPDAVAAGERDIVVLRGRGGGSFDADPIETIDTGTRAASLAFVDAGGDGFDDLAVSLPDQNTVRFFRSEGGGMFSAAGVRSGTRPTPLALGDFNGDGRLDLAVGEAGGIAVYLATGTGLASQAIRSGGGAAATLERSDLNGDGFADLLGLVAGGEALRIWLGNGDGTFAIAGETEIRASGRDVALADLDGDRLLDTVATAPAELAVGTNTTPVLFLVGDVNRDGAVNTLDLAALPGEIFDGDGGDADSCGGGRQRSDAGADVNGDRLISVADTTSLGELLAE